MNKTFITLSILSIFLFSACSDKDEPNGGNETHETTQSVQGKVEKGPFVRGSIIELRTLNADMSATGKSFTATIENNFGNFDFGTITAESQYAKLQAEGYFFNEVKGELSPSTINLNAIVDLTDSRTVNVNILTHLKSERIVSLVKQGSTYKEANTQAQKELLTAFGLQNLALKDASQFSIASGDDAAGALIAISSLVLYDRSVAETVEFLSQLTAEFSQYGTFRPETKETLRKTRNDLNSSLSTIESNVRQRYSELGIDVNVKDLAYFFDWDGNGISGDELESEISLETTSIEAPVEGGNFTIRINSNKPYFLEVPDAVKDGNSLTPDDPHTEDIFFSGLYEGDYSPKAIKMTKEINNNQISINVSAAEFYSTQATSFSLFNARGEEVALITIRQIGKSGINQDVPKLGEAGRGWIAGYLADVNSAFFWLENKELSYVRNPERGIKPSEQNISQSWQAFYGAINKMLRVKEADKGAFNVYQDYCNMHIALLYTTMLSYWDGVTFFTEYSQINEAMGSGRFPGRTSKAEMIETLLAWTIPALESFPEGKIDMQDVNSAFFLSKDFVRVIRAKLLMEKGDYANALPLLETVINGGRHSLTTENVIKYDIKTECIFSTSIGNTDRYTMNGIQFEESATPIIDLKEVYFDAAECDAHVNGNSGRSRFITNLYNAKGLSASEYTGLSAVEDAKRTVRTPFTVPCIRRSGIENCILDINSSQWYQMVWPIPDSELMTNPSMTQNPGY